MTPEGYRIVKEVLEATEGITLNTMTEPRPGEDVAEVVILTTDTHRNLVFTALYGAGILDDSPNPPDNPNDTPRLVPLAATPGRIRFHDQNAGRSIYDD